MKNGKTRKMERADDSRKESPMHRNKKKSEEEPGGFTKQLLSSAGAAHGTEQQREGINDQTALEVSSVEYISFSS